MATDAEVTSAISAQFVAGKNKIINGDFSIWQRGTSFAGLTADTYTADRFVYLASGATATVTRQTFTPGTAPVAGYESSFFYRTEATVANDNWGAEQRIEDVRTFAGQTVTLSFWAKTNTPLSIFGRIDQKFGSGGSSTVIQSGPAATSTTSWARYSTTFTLDSIAGKTIGTGSSLAVSIKINTNATGTLDIWGVQLEAGSTASAFQTATGTKQGELAACQRYYFRAGISDAGTTSALTNFAFMQGTTTAVGLMALPVEMRSSPTSMDSSNIAFRNSSGTSVAISSVTLSVASTTSVMIYGTVTTQTASTPGFIAKNSNAAGYLGFSAEL
jgi:hypothetical protein